MNIKYVASGSRYSKAVIHGSTVYLTGTVAKDPVPDVVEQTRMVLTQIDATLKLCGTDKSRLLTATIMFADMRDFDAVNDVWDSWVDKDNLPARTPVEVRLVTPRHLVAIQVTAAL